MENRRPVTEKVEVHAKPGIVQCLSQNAMSGIMGVERLFPIMSETHKFYGDDPELNAAPSVSALLEREMT
jgi:hypothetical protein